MIVLDPGHPSHEDDQGVTVKDFREVDYNYDRAVRLGRALTGFGVPWQMTRGAGEVMGLADRGRFGRRAGAECVISIHVNANLDPRVRGMMTFYRGGSFRSEAIAQAIQNAVPDGLRRSSPRPTEATPDDWTRRAYNVLASHHCQAVLVECGFATSPEDLARLQEPSTILGIESAILCGIAEALDRS